ncbi:phage major tail tube protein [Rhodopseudomonas palustris]|nr:phage major tail tube protein [Rhodopseudomonas palustris]
MSTIYIMEAVNLFCGDDDPTKSKHLTITELKLPNLEEVFVKHTPGGGRGSVKLGMNLLNELEPTFKLAGWDPDLLSAFGLGSKIRKIYTAYGVIRDKRTGAPLEAKAIIEARLGKIDAEAFKRGELQGHDYALNEVMHYELWFKDKRKFCFDFFTNEWEVDGVKEFASENSILRIPGAS